MAHIPHVRVSPINGIGVQWSQNVKDFKANGLPTNDGKVNPFCGCQQPLITKTYDPCPQALEVEMAVDTYDWSRFLSEVIVGIDDSDEEIAASYIREAAIEVCHTAHCLIRDVTLPLIRGENKFILETFDFERIDGISKVALEDGSMCSCRGFKGSPIRGLRYEFKPGTNELTITDERFGAFNHKNRVVNVRFWAIPTEDACRYDAILYENFRRVIATVARVRYVKAVHFKDRALMYSLPRENEVNQLILTAKAQAVQLSNGRMPVSNLFGG